MTQHVITPLRSDVPLPVRRNKAPRIYNWLDMKIGDSFFTTQRFTSYARISRDYKIKLTVRKRREIVGEGHSPINGWRIWRIE